MAKEEVMVEKIFVNAIERIRCDASVFVGMKRFDISAAILISNIELKIFFKYKHIQFILQKIVFCLCVTNRITFY